MILAILQARMSSRRLPGKVLMPILNKPVLELQIERILRASSIHHLIVATSEHVSDDVIEELCSKIQVDCFRGSLDDVLSRYYHAALLYPEVQHIIRLTGDCPVIDPEIIDSVVTYHLEGGFDYTSNVGTLTFPDGLDVEIFRKNMLEKAFFEANTPFEREHVTPYMRTSNAQLGSYENKNNNAEYRWTLDETEDFILINKIYNHLYRDNHQFDMADILNVMNQHPELKYINSHLVRDTRRIKSEIPG